MPFGERRRKTAKLERGVRRASVMQKVSSTTTTRHLELHLPTTRERESNARGGRVSTQGGERVYREKGTETKCYIIREAEIES